MKKLLIGGLLVFLLVVYYGCSKDHENLVFDPTQGLAKPAEIDTIIFNSTTRTISLVWIQDDTANVVGYHVFMADTSAIYDAGFIKEWLTVSTDTTFVIKSSYTDPEKLLKEPGDSTWFYFGVAAVNEDGFTGPLSDVDSVVIFR